MNAQGIENIRRAMLEAYAAGVAAVDGERVTEAWLADRPLGDAVAVIALGKASGAMARGAQRALDGRLDRGLVVTKAGHADVDGLNRQRFAVVEASHPVPDERSLAAGQALRDFIEAMPAAMPVIVLISGGASALVEVLADGVTLDDLARVNSWLLGNGLPIGQMNAVRRRLSLIKGGGLARLLAPRAVTGLLISDVAGDDPAVIGSGPLTPPVDSALPDGLPDWLQAILSDIEAGPMADDAALSLEVQVIARLDDALDAAALSLQAAGLAVQRHTRHFDAPLDQVVETVAAASAAAPGQVQLWGGEATLVLPEAPGRGGRNQQLALRLAVEIAGAAPAVALSAGTDGTDGPTGDAGAIVDNQTVSRGDGQGLAADDCLRRADAGSYLEESGDLITTGPTGTNVTDLIMAWRG